MKSKVDSNIAFWSVLLKLSRDIYDIYSFIIDEVPHHLPVLSKDQFNAIKRLDKSAHDLGQVACSMLNKLNEDESSREN